jgi:hypothetical protein
VEAGRTVAIGTVVHRVGETSAARQGDGARHPVVGSVPSLPARTIALIG